MSSLLAANTFTHDVLDNLRLKPWWEVWREYAYRASIAIIALVAFSPEARFHCLHKNSGITEMHLTTVQAKVVDSYCKDKIVFKYILHSDIIAFGMSLMIYIIANYWIHKSGVKDKLTDISKFGRSFMKLKISVHEMKNISVYPVTASSDKIRQLIRKNVMILQKYSMQRSTLQDIYTTRCLLLMLFTVICYALVITFYIFNNNQYLVTCDVPSSIIQLAPGNSSSMFTCVNDKSSFDYWFGVMFAVTVALQTLSMLFALWKCGFAKLDPEKYRKYPILYIFLIIFISRYVEKYPKEDIGYFLITMMGIDAGQAASIGGFIEFVRLNNAFPTRLMSKSGEAIAVGDMDFFRILKNRMKNERKFYEEVEKAATYALSQGDNVAECEQGTQENTISDYKVYIFLDNIVEPSTEEAPIVEPSSIDPGFLDKLKLLHKSGSKHSVFFISLSLSLIRKCNWHLQSCLPLIYAKPTLTNQEINRTINNDILFDKLDAKGRSYLYYALRKSSMDNLVNRFCHFNELMKTTESKRKKLVHFDGKSMPVEKFFHLEYPGVYRGQNPDFRLCDTKRIDPSNECESELKEILAIYNPDQCIAAGKNTASRASRFNSLKLSNPQTVNRSVIARILAFKHWEVLVALINTYIVVYVQGNRPDTHDLIGKDIFDLRNRNDLEVIFKEALKRPRDRMYFVPTAAEHILSVMSSQEIDGAIKHIDAAPLDNDIRERLKRLARKFQT